MNDEERDTDAGHAPEHYKCDLRDARARVDGTRLHEMVRRVLQHCYTSMVFICGTSGSRLDFTATRNCT